MGIGRIAFIGAGAFGVPLLSLLPELADELLVVSQPDRPAGRRLQLRPSPVAAWARGRGIATGTPRRLRSAEGRSLIAGFRPDGLILASYGQLVPEDLLAAAPRPSLNVHPSLLPRHRGAAPVAATILAGDDEAGVTLMVMTPELDAGPIVGQWRVPLTGRETAPDLEGRLADLAAEVIPPELSRWAAGGLVQTEQDPATATLVRPFTRADGWIDWRQDAARIDRQVRALQPWPGAWTTVGGRRLHLRRARPVPSSADAPPGTLLPDDEPRVQCGVGALVLEVVQPEGRGPMPAAAWRRGLTGERIVLGATPPGVGIAPTKGG